MYIFLPVREDLLPLQHRGKFPSEYAPPPSKKEMNEVGLMILRVSKALQNMRSKVRFLRLHPISEKVC